MQLAMLGLGKMGGNMVQRLLKGGHRVIAYDVDPRRATELAALGAAPPPRSTRFRRAAAAARVLEHGAGGPDHRGAGELARRCACRAAT